MESPIVVGLTSTPKGIRISLNVVFLASPYKGRLANSAALSALVFNRACREVILLQSGLVAYRPRNASV